jgi:hypothetical protein
MKLKHIKLFEGYNSNFLPEDISLPGDSVLCWNFGDGWLVALLDKENSLNMHQYLEENQSNLVTNEKYLNKEGIAFVITGIPTDLDVEFVGSNFDTSSVDYLVSSKGVEENLANKFSSSCAFTLKRNHVIGNMWNGNHFCIPIQEYLYKY